MNCSQIIVDDNATTATSSSSSSNATNTNTSRRRDDVYDDLSSSSSSTSMENNNNKKTTTNRNNKKKIRYKENIYEEEFEEDDDDDDDDDDYCVFDFDSSSYSSYWPMTTKAAESAFSHHQQQQELSSADENRRNHQNGPPLKSVYDELAEKEEALLLAAQFGKSLIDEKEELERHLESIKREHQIQIEFKRLMDNVRNEYELKLGELNEDINFMRKQLKQKEAELAASRKLIAQNESAEIIQDLTEKNQKLKNQLKAYESQMSMSAEKYQILEISLHDKEKTLNENSKLLINYQIEINKLVNKQKELEFVLIQSCNEREKQAKIIEELTNKFLIVENEKNELEQMMYQHENEIVNLRDLNKSLVLKLKSMTTTTTTTTTTVVAAVDKLETSKRKSIAAISTVRDNNNNMSVHNDNNNSNEMTNTSVAYEDDDDDDDVDGGEEDGNELNVRSKKSTQLSSNSSSSNSSSSSSSNAANSSVAAIETATVQDANPDGECLIATTPPPQSQPNTAESRTVATTRSVYFDYNSNSNIYDNSEFDDDYEIGSNSCCFDSFRQNEIEQDDIDDEHISSNSPPFYDKMTYLDHHQQAQQHQNQQQEHLYAAAGGVNWASELASEHKLSESSNGQTGGGGEGGDDEELRPS